MNEWSEFERGDARWTDIQPSCWRRRHAVEASLRKHGHEGALASLDALDAALWLLFVGQYSQSLVSFFNAIETAMKAVLKEMDPRLILEGGKKGKAGKAEEAVRDLLFRDLLCKFHGGRTALLWLRSSKDKSDGEGGPDKAGDTDQARSCNAEEAHGRLRQLRFRLPGFRISYSAEVGLSYLCLVGLRHSVIHRGPDRRKALDYIELILAVAWPLLAAVLAQGFGIKLLDWISKPLCRQMKVAHDYLKLVRRDPSLPSRPWEVLATYTCQFRLLHVHRVASHSALFGFSRDALDLVDCDDATIIRRDYSDRDRWHQLCLERVVADAKWRRTFSPLTCRICGEDRLIAAITLPPAGEAVTRLSARGLLCSHCGLDIPIPKDPTAQNPLAELHYGPITKDRVGRNAWEEFFAASGPDG